MAEKTELVVSNKADIATNTTSIQNMIYVVRGVQVMIDSDLAMLYQVETRVFNQAVKRNIARFPDNFRFQLTKDEYDSLRSQIVILNEGGRGVHRKYLPYVFTEQGIAMLASVLRSDVAIQVSINIMNTFVEMRRYLAHNSLILEKLNGLEQHQIASDIRLDNFEKQTNERLEQVFDYIEEHKAENQKIFYDGQIFDAFNLLTNLVHQADKTITLIDGYVDVATLNILAKKKPGVDVTIYTLAGTRYKLTSQDVANFNAQYPHLYVKHTLAFHDRFMIVDESTGYHIGASLKDAGRKCFGINKIEDVGVIKDILQRAALTVQ